LVAAWKYSCKSRKAQRRFPRQRETASLSACTLIFVIFLLFALLIVGFGIFVLFDESFAASPFSGPQLEGSTSNAQTQSPTTKAMFEALQAAARHAKAWRQRHHWHWGVIQMTQYPSTVIQPASKGFLARPELLHTPVRVVTFTA
jgi:nitroreductase